MLWKTKQKDWLPRYLQELLDAGLPPCPLSHERSADPDENARRYCDAFVAHHGFDYAELCPTEIGALFETRLRCDPEQRSFFELVTTYAQLSVGIAEIYERSAATERRVRELGLLLAAVFGLRAQASDLGRSLEPDPFDFDDADELAQNAFRKLSKHLDAIAENYRDPLYAATLKASFRYADVRLLGELATDLYARGLYDHVRMVELYLDRVDERRLLFQGAIAIAWADGEMAPEERRFLRNLLDLANLPDAVTAELRRSIETDDLLLPELAGQITRPETRRFFFRQLVMISLADGVQLESELEMLDNIANRLEIDEEERDRLSAEALAYYQSHDDLFDHSVLGAFNRFRGRVAHRVTSIVRSNTDKIMTEVRQTKELALLLGKASKEPLDADEKKRVREQLLDIAKTVPALAIFVIPGGSLVFAVLCKVLPFNLLPSAFADEG